MHLGRACVKSDLEDTHLERGRDGGYVVTTETPSVNGTFGMNVILEVTNLLILKKIKVRLKGSSLIIGTDTRWPFYCQVLKCSALIFASV